ncbi:MAG: GNAT family N-acetyltransferase [Proteobacteria bacterium]|nr:GNAT family N-acetyltransferase [Pseudomonadota bacterium]
MTHEWVAYWWRHFGRPQSSLKRSELFVLALRIRGRLCGIAPFFIEEERFLGISARIVRFLGHGVSDYSDFIIAESRDAMLQNIVRHLAGYTVEWDMIELRDFYGASPNRSVLEGLIENAGFARSMGLDNICRFIHIEGDWEDYYKSRFKNRRRKEHKREWRNLKAGGDIRLRFVTSLEDEPGLLDIMAEMERHHPDVKRGRPGQLNTDAYRKFFEDVFPQFAMLGWLNIALMECDGRAVAYYLGFRYNRRHYTYMSSYLDEFRELGVGKLLMLRMLEHYWLSGDDEIDFLRGDETYKGDWTTDARQNTRLVVSKRSLHAFYLRWFFFVLLPWMERRLPRVHKALSVASEGGLTALVRLVYHRLKRVISGGDDGSVQCREKRR